MERYPDPLIVRVDDLDLHEKPFALVKPFRFISKVFGDQEITAPENFRTDFASVPRILHRVVSPVGRGYNRAAVIHDWLCVVSPKLCDSVTAAKIFLEAMQYGGTPEVKAHLIFTNVVKFGPHFKAGDE